MSDPAALCRPYRRHGARTGALTLCGFALALSWMPAAAMTWEFAEAGNTMGWRGSQHFATASTPRPIRVDVADGSLRVPLDSFTEGQVWAVQLTSPPIDQPSALFDQLRIRVRVDHADPVPASVALTWTNEHNLAAPGEAPTSTGPDASDPRPWLFAASRRSVLTTEWQEVVLSDLRARSVDQDGTEYRMMWEGELEDLRIVISPDAPAPALPTAVELDWIQLTGVEEQMQGELEPPAVTATTTFGDLLHAAVFHGLDAPGVGTVPTLIYPAGSLGDLEGDGDLDIAAYWQDNTYGASGVGYILARNDGMGAYRLLTRVELGSGLTVPMVAPRCADLDGDGIADLALMVGIGGQLLRSTGDGRHEPWHTWPDAFPVPGDADGDGDADLYVIQYAHADDSSQSSGTELWLMVRERDGGLGEPTLACAPGPNWYSLATPLLRLPGGQDGVLWSKQPDLRGLSWLASTGECEWITLELHDYNGLLHYAGDIHGDGTITLCHSQQRVTGRDTGVYHAGLTLTEIHLDGSSASSAEWLPATTQLLGNAVWADLDGDAWLDAAMVQRRQGYPFLVVYRGMPEGLPVEEGRYPLDGTGKGTVLSGDLNGDDRIDIAVLEPSGPGNIGGVHVLLNRMTVGTTAVATAPCADREESGAGASGTPASALLRPLYPNPFNPEVTVPFRLAADAGHARLRVYDVLGKPVRTLVNGGLTAGEHQVVWDGRDAAGEDVSSGMYLIRLEVPGRTVTARCLRIE